MSFETDHDFKTGPNGRPWCPYKCGCELEVLYGDTDTTILHCPKCGHEEVADD